MAISRSHLPSGLRVQRVSSRSLRRRPASQRWRSTVPESCREDCHRSSGRHSRHQTSEARRMSDQTETRWGWLVVPAVIALGIFASVTGLCSHHETPQEYWNGAGRQLIEKARQDEIEARTRFETASPADREGARLGLELATEVRKRYEAARDRNVGPQP